ncbi:hypothetical protein PanWU01x14_357020 [Parasponia andersonii]|uniref:DOG1 domain-containing protein n=1 Tax=Parasponia andersonii TaxID=3476 RepID=A0A2P5A8S1_PARAD|nr:hypothetical protein PanWU01x14_357020 [Parasponia andersonii]
MEEEIENISVSIAAMGHKIDGLVNAAKDNGEVVELQAKLAFELQKVRGQLSDRDVFRALNILATNYDLLRVFSAMPREMKVAYVRDLGTYGIR